MVPKGWLASELELEGEFCCQRAFFQIPFWGHISTTDQDIFIKFGVCIENGVPQHVEWSMYAHLEYPRWRTAVNSSQLNRHNSAVDCQISFKFYTMADMNVAWTWLIYS